MVKALDIERNNEEVAIKIIKRSGPKQNFLLQAQTEIGLLRRIEERQKGLGDNHIGRLNLLLLYGIGGCSCHEPVSHLLRLHFFFSLSLCSTPIEYIHAQRPSMYCL